MSKNTSSKKVLFNSIIYSVSGLLLKCFSFFLLPLYTKYLTTEDYGITSIATSFINVSGFIVAFSLFSAVMRFYVDLKDDKEKLRRFYGTITVFVFVSSILAAILLFLFRSILARYVFSGVNFFPVIFICLISLVFHCQQAIYDNILRSQQKAFKSSILSIATFFVTLVLNLFFVIHLKMGATGTLLATLISYIGYSIYFHVDMIAKHEIVFCFDSVLLKKALRYSIPIMPHNLSTQIAMLISKVLIGDTASLASLGVYSIAAQFGNMADTIQGYVDQAYGPWLYEKLHDKEQDNNSSIRKIVNGLVSIIGLFFIGISLFAHDYIVLLINKNYIDAWKYVPLIVMVFSIKTIYYFYVEILFFYKQASKYLFIATLSSSILNIFLSYFLIPVYGVYGSILADALAMIIRVGIVVYISRKYGSIGLRIKDFIVNIVLVGIFICGGLSLSYLKYYDTFNINNFLFKLLILLLYIVTMFVMNRDVMKPLLKHFYSKFRERIKS